MRMKKFIFTFMIIVTSCSKINIVTDNQYNPKNSHIPVQEALKCMYKTIGLIHPETKSSSFSIKDISVIKHDTFKTKANIDTDSLFYIVNFENNNGYAVLSANNHFADTVLMLIDSGNFNIDSVDFELGISDPNSFGATLLSISLPGEGDDFISDFDPNLDNDTDPNPVTYYVDPILNTKWHQGYPFNKNFSGPDDTSRWPAGCAVIAAAQILVANKDVSLTQHFNISTSTWNDLERNFDEYWDPCINVRIEDIASIIKTMADEIDVTYNFLNSGGTFAFPRWVKNYLHSIGYSNIQKHTGFSSTNIAYQLADGKPVFIASLNDPITDGGHAWVIDGYIINGSSILFHCNMGWGGISDGYYSPTLFNSTDGPVAFDDNDLGQVTSDAFNYDLFFRYLTY